MVLKPGEKHRGFGSNFLYPFLKIPAEHIFPAYCLNLTP